MTSMEGLATGPGMAEGMTEPGVGSAKSESYEEAKPESTETTILNLEEFMDVEYTYRCKFCPFTCNSMNGVTAHILSCHMPNKDSTRVEGSERVVRVSGGHGDVCGGAQVLAAPVEEPGGRVAGPAVAADIVAESITMAVGQLSGTVVGEEEEEAGTVGQSQSAGTGQQTFAYVGSQDLGKTSADADAATGSDVTVVETGSPGSEYREVFLCGQCSLGFTSMEECKEHMFKDHNISIASMEKSEHEDVAVETQADEVAESPFKVSVGTQAETFKKPGRKRKPKVAVDEVPGGADSDTGLGLLKAVKKEVSLLSSQYQKERESQGKRRVRLPKVLQEEYLVSKRRPNRGHTREKWTLQCDVPGCQGKFKTDGSLQYHLTCHVIPAHEPSGDDGATARKSPEIPASASNLVCPQCSMQFDTWRPLRLHLWTKHRVDMDLLKCYQCDFRTDRARKLEVHEEIHSDDKPYECGVCDKAFKQLAQLKNHEVTHQGQRLPRTDQRWYHSKQCHICNRLLADSKSLKKHIEIVHEKLKPYKCEFCGHVTSRKHMLLVHLRTHTGEKPHKCDMCSFETSDHNTLRRHRMRHTGQKPYKCQYCAYSCIQAVSLKIHMKNKHPGSAGLFYCDQCHYHTVNARSWHQHQEDHSTGLIESQQLLQQQREDEGRAEHETLTLKRAAEASGVWPEQGAENAAVSLMSLTGGTASTEASTAPVQLQFEVVQQQESMRGDAGATADAPASAAAGGIQSLVLADTAGDGVQYVYCSAENASPLGGAQQDAKATTLDAIRLADIGVLQQQNSGKQDALYAVAYQAVGSDAQTNSPANSVLSNLGQVEVIPGGAGFMYTPQTQQSHAGSDAVATTTAMETVQIQGGTVVHGEPMAVTRSARGASNSRIKFSSAGNLVVTSGKSGEMTVANDSQATTHILNFPSGTSMEQILEALQQGRLKTSNS